MAIVIIDNRLCPGCGQKPGPGNSYSFDEFVKNPKISFARFNKTNWHLACLSKDPQGEAAKGLADLYKENTRPAGRICAIEGKAVPAAQRIFMEFVTDDASSILYGMTFQNYRISALEQWKEKPRLVKALKRLKQQYPDMTVYAGDIISKIGDVPDEPGGFLGKLKGLFGR